MDVICQNETVGRPNDMTVLEMDAFCMFIAQYCNNTDLMNVAEVMSPGPTVNTDIMTTLQQLKRERNMELLNDDIVITKFSLSRLVEALYFKGYHVTAEKLYCCYLASQSSTAILRMNKVQTENRRKISLYFKNIKKLVHEIAFKNPHADVKRLSRIMKENIESEVNPVRKMFLCDKYTALKAAEMDALINITGDVSPNHEGYYEIESFITSTSSPSLSQVILYGRKADVLSTAGDFEEGEKLLRAAYVSADYSAPCVEITDMIYKNVVFKLSQLERTPTVDLQKSLALEASRGIWSLNDESDDMRVFWKRLFLLRMAFSLLGIGKFCNLIQNYVPTEASLLEAESLLSCNDLNDMEHRRMMFYFAAKARLEQWKGEFSQAFALVQVANKYAREGNYVEGRYLREYERELDSLKQKSECVRDDTFTFNRPILYTDNTELSDVTISFNSIIISDSSSGSE